MGEIPDGSSALGWKLRVSCSWKLRKGDPPLPQLWTAVLLEGHFAPTEEERWAGLQFWCLEMMATWEDRLEASRGRKVSTLTCLTSLPVAALLPCRCSLDQTCFLHM